jgi:hypothetical protein
VAQITGKFIINAPTAYHAGFNAGYIAEATNLAFEDWPPF